MWNPLKRGKKTAPNADLPRSAAGQFQSRASVLPIDQAVEKETKAVTNVLELLGAVRKMAAEENSLIDAKVQAALEGYEGEEPGAAYEGWIPIVQVVAPYLPGIFDRLGIQKSSIETPPSSSPPTQSPSPPAGLTAKSLIEMAANHSPTEIKAALVLQGYSELEQQGIKKETFKQAIQNIAKAI